MNVVSKIVSFKSAIEIVKNNLYLFDLNFVCEVNPFKTFQQFISCLHLAFLILLFVIINIPFHKKFKWSLDSRQTAFVFFKFSKIGLILNAHLLCQNCKQFCKSPFQTVYLTAFYRIVPTFRLVIWKFLNFYPYLIGKMFAFQLLQNSISLKLSVIFGEQDHILNCR